MTTTLVDTKVPEATQPRRPTRLSQIMGRWAMLGIAVAIALFFAVWPVTAETFRSPANLRILIASQAVVAIIALAALIPLICNEFDLSIGPTAGLAATTAAAALSGGRPIALAIALAIGVGLVVGVVNALLVTRAGVNGVVTTLGTSTILIGIVNQRTGGLAIVSDIPRSFTRFGTGTNFGVPTVAIALIAAVAVTWFLLDHTPFGRRLSAIGSNPEAAALLGLPVRSTLAMSFVLAGGLSAVAGVVYVSRAGGADPSIGNQFTLPALAAALLSAAAVRPGRYNVGGTIVAIFFVAVLNNGLNIAGAKPYLTNYVNGLALILGVALAVALHRRASQGW